MNYFVVNKNGEVAGENLSLEDAEKLATSLKEKSGIEWFVYNVTEEY